MEQKRGEGKQIIRKRSKLGQGVGALKGGGAGTPLWIMIIFFVPFSFLPLASIMLESLDETCAILEVELVSEAIGSTK